MSSTEADTEILRAFYARWLNGHPAASEPPPASAQSHFTARADESDYLHEFSAGETGGQAQGAVDVLRRPPGGRSGRGPGPAR